MSVATEITRIQGAKADLKTSIEAKGVTVPSATLISGYAALVDQISGGGIPDSDGLVDLQITTGDQTGIDSFTLSYMPTYLLRCSPSAAISALTGFSVSKSVTYPSIVWSCNNQSITISGSTVNVPSSVNSNVTFTATWVDCNGETQNTSKTIHVKGLSYAMIIITTDTVIVNEYYVTTTDPYSLGLQYNNFESYQHRGTTYYICNYSTTLPEWMSSYKVLSSNGTSATLFSTSAAAKSAIDTL